MITTIVVTEAVLFDGSRSAYRGAARTVARLTTCPAAWGRTITLMVAEPLTGKVPTEQVTVSPETAQLPLLLVAETKVTPVPRLSWTIMLGASDGPLFLAVIAYRSCPVKTCDAVMVTERSTASRT